jgi:hypothetical protein
MPKLNPAIIALAAVALMALNVYAANATATDAFHLWLKCKTVELYINTTGANFTLLQCEVVLTRYNYTFLVGRSGVRPLPMIGVGELKKLNATDPKASFDQLKAIRLAALANLTRHVNKTMERLFRGARTRSWNTLLLSPTSSPLRDAKLSPRSTSSSAKNEAD